MDASTFLERQRQGRAEWDKLMQSLNLERIRTSAVSDEWFMKDIIAHIAWYEQEMVTVIETHSLAGSDLWNLPVDQRNAAIYDLNRERQLDENLADERQIYDRLFQALNGLSDADLLDPNRFKDMPADWKPWEMIASNCYEHYREHIPRIQAWLDANR